LVRAVLAGILVFGTLAACGKGSKSDVSPPTDAPTSTGHYTNSRTASFTATITEQPQKCKGWIVHVTFVPGIPPKGGDSFNAIAHYTVRANGKTVTTGKLDVNDEKVDVPIPADTHPGVKNVQIDVYRAEERKGGISPAKPGGVTQHPNPDPC
jgi:hypothetical protein